MTAEPLVCAIDQGTTGTRCMLFDHQSRPVASAYETHEQHYPQAGWVEHDPMEIWEVTKRTVHDALREASVEATDLAAIGIANQRETTVIWDAETGEPCHNAIVWQDRRTADRIDEVVGDGWEDEIRARTGLEPDAYFSATKIEWLLEHADRPRETEQLRVGTIDTWLIDRMTGAHLTDVTNASRTMLFNIDTEAWDPDLLDLFDIPRSILPSVRPSIDREAYGHTDSDGWLGAEIPVTGVLGDQQAALFGQTCFERGEAKNTYGTGSFLLLNTGVERVDSEHGLISTIAYGIAGEPTRYALEGSIFVTGAAIEWLADVGIVSEPEETEALAQSVEDTDDVYLVPAFTGLGAPHWNPRARGTIVGMTRDTSRAHLARAGLEAIGYLTKDVADAMTADAGAALETLRIDGGAVQNDALCQIQADVLGIPVLRPTVEETTALGAAYAAGLAVGVWDDRESLRSRWRVDATFEPGVDPTLMARQHARWRDAVDRARGWATE